LVKLIQTNLKLLFGRRFIIFFFLVTPLLLSLVVESVNSNYVSKTITVAFSDEDNSASSIKIKDALLSGGGIQVLITNSQEADKLLKDMKVEASIRVLKGLSESIVKKTNGKMIKLTTVPYSAAGGILSELIGTTVLSASAEVLAQDTVKKIYLENGKTYNVQEKKKTADLFKSLGNQVQMLQIDFQTYPNDKQPLPVNLYFAGSLGVFMLFLMMFAVYSSDIFASNLENGVFNKSASVKFGLFKSVSALVISLFLVGMLQAIVYIAFLSYTKNIGITVFFELLFVIVLALGMFIGIGFLLSVLLKKKESIHVTAFYLSLITGLAGGCFFNIGTGTLKEISMFLPQGFVINIFDGIMTNNDSILNSKVAILTGFAFFLMIISYGFFKRQLQHK